MLSELAVPLLRNGQVLGVLSVESSHSNAFTEYDQEVLKVLANLAVIVLQQLECEGTRF